MIQRVIIMCAGKAQRWANHRDIPKHLISIDGETLLDRTLRLIRLHTAAPTVIAAFDPRYSREGFERFEPDHGPTNFFDTDKFLSAQERWAESGQTVLLYGDVFFTEPAMKTILSHVGEHRFFGRREKSYITGRPWREMFALSFPDTERDQLRMHMLELRSDLLAGKIQRGGGWELFRRIHGFTWNHFTAIDDFTDDFDYPDDYEKWIRRYRNPLHRALSPIYSSLMKRGEWRWKKFNSTIARITQKTALRIVLVLFTCALVSRGANPIPENHMKYKSVETANAQGFSKVNLGTGETYAEGVIDSAGKEIIPPSTHLLVNSIDASTALVQRGRGFLFVDLDKQRADPTEIDKATVYDFANQYTCGLAMVMLNDETFYIDRAGNPCFGEKFTFGESFHHDRALVMNDGKYRIIETTGKTVAELKYDQVNLYSPTRFQVTNIKKEVYWSGFVDLAGKEVVPLIYDEVGYFDAEIKRTRVGIKDKYGFLDELGNVAIPIQFEYAEIFSQGKARVILKGRDFFIDPTGKEVP